MNDKVSEEKFTLDNLNENLLKLEYSESIEFVCIDEGYECLILIDEDIENYTIVEDFFKSKPEIYEYSQDLDRIDYDRIELEELTSYEVCFRYKIDKYGKADDVIVKTLEDGVYIFNSIHKKPIKIKYLNDVNDYFYEKEKRVRDAF